MLYLFVTTRVTGKPPWKVTWSRFPDTTREVCMCACCTGSVKPKVAFKGKSMDKTFVCLRSSCPSAVFLLHRITGDFVRSHMKIKYYRPCKRPKILGSTFMGINENGMKNSALPVNSRGTKTLRSRPEDHRWTSVPDTREPWIQPGESHVRKLPSPPLCKVTICFTHTQKKT